MGFFSTPTVRRRFDRCTQRPGLLRLCEQPRHVLPEAGRSRGARWPPPPHCQAAPCCLPVYRTWCQRVYNSLPPDWLAWALFQASITKTCTTSTPTCPGKRWPTAAALLQRSRRPPAPEHSLGSSMLFLVIACPARQPCTVFLLTCCVFCVSSRLLRPGGVYSFFNGLAPDNLFFHLVYGEIARRELGRLGLNTCYEPVPMDASGACRTLLQVMVEVAGMCPALLARPTDKAKTSPLVMQPRKSGRALPTVTGTSLCTLCQHAS